MWLTRHYEDVSVLVSVVCAVTGRTVADRKARSLVADQLKDDYWLAKTEILLHRLFFMPGIGGSNKSNITEHNNELFSLSKRLAALLNFYIKSSAYNFKNI